MWRPTTNKMNDEPRFMQLLEPILLLVFIAIIAVLLRLL